MGSSCSPFVLRAPCISVFIDLITLKAYRSWIPSFCSPLQFPATFFLLDPNIFHHAKFSHSVCNPPWVSCFAQTFERMARPGRICMRIKSCETTIHCSLWRYNQVGGRLKYCMIVNFCSLTAYEIQQGLSLIPIAVIVYRNTLYLRHFQVRGLRECFATWYAVTSRSSQHLTQHPSWRTSPCRLSESAYLT